MSIEKGKKYEGEVAKRLESAGCTIIERNYHTRYGEIDIIAKNDKYLIFAEVKARKLGAKVGAIYSVDRAKIRKICKSALLYTAEHPTELQPRFDLIALTFSPDGSVCEYNHIENAFDFEVDYETF